MLNGSGSRDVDAMVKYTNVCKIGVVEEFKDGDEARSSKQAQQGQFR
jgi:hypothetical protein